jgi:hypothetical protein
MPRRFVVFLLLVALLIGGLVAAGRFDVDVSGGVLRVIDAAFRWVLVPATLIGQLAFAYWLVRRPGATDDETISKWMALMLGSAIFVIVIVLNRRSEMFTPGTPLDAFDSPWRYGLLGGVAGIALMVFVDTALASRTISIFIAIVTSASLCALYFYFFIEQLQDPILLVSLSMLAVVIAYVMMLPRVARQFRKPA